jgi:AcrR family transcriptional regulator
MADANVPPDPIATLQAQLVAARRTQILDAATQVFARKGFNRATIRDVAKVAGVADGTIYNYFANKTDLLFGLLDRLNDTERRPASLALPGQSRAACTLLRRGDCAHDGAG